jgi:tetratricopeptide (TPR) repeat protein/predicted Ser/Thr protein kinase
MISRSERLEELFDRAVDLAAPARAALLANECADDPELQRELLELLAADAGPVASALESAMAPVAAVALPVAGALVAGRYRIVRQIGEGGMGVVFEAEQQEPRRRVALKCIRPGTFDATALQRFKREAEALGRLQHPGIAAVFESGVHDGPPALPFLAMEFVDGRPLAEVAAGLSLQEQLALLAALAEAVGHAHERGIVHRDLKPSNILVEFGSAGPRPRVLDFGIARLHGDASATVYTRTHQVIGTLAYMSPEQVQHGASTADPRSDVWSLGVIAYELLAGQPPLPLTAVSLAEAARLLRDEEPKPIERLVPAARGDVATIVHKALAKDPTLRYADAGALAADLRRLLANLPIAARPPSAVYQVRRFARRHRGLMVGLAATFVALFAGLVVAIVLAAQATAERDRARLRTDELRAMLRTLLSDVNQELASVPGALGARRTLLRAGQQHAAGMAQDALAGGDDPALLLEVAGLFEVLADVEGQPGEANLGNLGGSLASLRSAFELVERAIAIDPQAVTARRARVRLFSQQDNVLRALGRRDEREQALVQQQAEAERVFELARDHDAERDRVMVGANRARFLAEAGRVAEALPGMVRAAEFLFAEWQATGDRDHLFSVCTLRIHIGNLHRQLGDLAAAQTAYDDAVALARADHQRIGDREGARNLAMTLRDAAVFHMRVQQHGEALPLLAAAAELLQPLVAAEASDLNLHKMLRVTETMRAEAMLRSGDTDGACAIAAPALATLVALVDAHPENRSLRRDLIPLRHLNVRIAAQLGDLPRAAQEAATALGAAEAARGADPDNAQAADDVLTSLGMVSVAAEASANAPDLAPEERARRQSALRQAIESHLALAEELADRGMLSGERRALLDELPQRLVALRRADAATPEAK